MGSDYLKQSADEHLQLPDWHHGLGIAASYSYKQKARFWRIPEVFQSVQDLRMSYEDHEGTQLQYVWRKGTIDPKRCKVTCVHICVNNSRPLYELPF
jgi:hypothetical protein